MIYLRTVTQNNYNECLELNREEKRFVGDTCAVLADAYIYRETSLAYAIYKDDYIIGLVILDEEGNDGSYEFTDLFIADDYRNKGYGEQVTIHIYQKCGFYNQRDFNK